MLSPTCNYRLSAPVEAKSSPNIKEFNTFIEIISKVKILSNWKFDIKRWWPISESNQGHTDFQSVALPTELIGHGKFCKLNL